MNTQSPKKDFPPQRWCGICAYDGTDFWGWQSQRGGNTLQDFLERRLGEIFQTTISIVGAGRTDGGVHARGQVFHFDAPHWPHGPSVLLRALQCGFPNTLRVKTIFPVSPDFHARFSATEKRYCYQLLPGWADPFQFRHCWPLGSRSPDLSAMESAATLFLGSHDFSAFANKRRNGSDGSPQKCLTRSEFFPKDGFLIYQTEANGYLYRMVRRLVGALVDVGLGKVDGEAIQRRLSFPEEFVLKPLTVAPPRGLFLDRVFYDDFPFPDGEKTLFNL
jgi:tRNA pseudouridine38-40 synthase